MGKETTLIPSISDVRNYVFYGNFVKLFSDVNFELCKIVQKNPSSEITLFDVKSYIQNPRKIAVIVSAKMGFVN